MPDLEISQLPELSGLGLRDSDAVPLADVSASETKKITAKNLIQSGISLIDNGSIPAEKVNLPSSSIPTGGVTTANLADGAVTDIKVGNVNGSKIVDASVSGAKFAGVTDRGLSQVNNLIGITNAVIPGTNAGISWDAQGLITGSTVIPSADLPIATTSDVGGVSVPATGGLSVTGTGQLSLNYQTTPGSVAGVSWNQYGNILSVAPLSSSDIPIATTSAVGGVKVPGTGGIVVSPDGSINLDATGVTAGTYTKVTCAADGRVVTGTVLAASDIPNLNASQITTGSLSSTLIGDRSITEIKLADFSTCLIQEGQPTGNYKLGQLWFTPSTNQLRVFGRGSDTNQGLWFSIGFGALQQNNLRWGGTVDASTGNITTLTDIGTAEGLVAGSAIPAATDALSGLYFVVDAAGSSVTIANVNGAQLTEGDWVLYIDQAQGAIHLDIAAGGGGGGGGASVLNDLTDVSITSVVDEQLLQYDATSGTWVNVSILEGGTY